MVYSVDHTESGVHDANGVAHIQSITGGVTAHSCRLNTGGKKLKKRRHLLFPRLWNSGGWGGGGSSSQVMLGMEEGMGWGHDDDVIYRGEGGETRVILG